MLSSALFRVTSHKGIAITFVLVSGCALPDYHLPRGFSSSYYRHLQEATPVWSTTEVLSNPAPSMELPQSNVPIPPAPGIP